MYHYFKTGFPENAHTKKLLEPIRQAAQQYKGTPIYALPYSKYKLLNETGSRVEYEAAYIEHRRRMNVFTAMVLSELENAEWVGELEDILWAVCDEYSWAFPAHMQFCKSSEERVKCLDLFACETGGALAEILELTGERLHKEVTERVTYEVRRRIIAPFLNECGDFAANNWAAVCAGSAATAAIRLGTESEAERAIEFANRQMEIFLKSYNDDGCCLEGSYYWGYGFGYFCYYAALVRDYTNGNIDWFKSEKVRKIAEFRQKVYLTGTYVIPFADAPHNIDFHIGLAHFLANEYDTVTPPNAELGSVFDDDIRHRFFDFIRDFYWYDARFENAALPEFGIYDFAEAEWFIRKNGDIAFAAKGGSNDELHNHNDVGSFILFDDGNFILDDLGWPEYDKAYFSDKRYLNLCASSRGHGVPIINGKYQTERGDTNADILKRTDEVIDIDISKAYGSIDINAKRSFDVSGILNCKNAIVMEDTFGGNAESVTERFVTRIRPEIYAGSVKISDWMISADTECDIVITEEQFEPRLSICKMDMMPVETAYLIDFVPKGKIQKIKFKVEKNKVRLLLP